MSDDLLSKYTQALAEEHDGATAVPEATRARVMRSLTDRGPRRSKWLVLGIPLLTVLGGSTAWAAASGQLAPLVHRASVALGLESAPSDEAPSLPIAGTERRASSRDTEEPSAELVADALEEPSEPVEDSTTEAEPSEAPTVSGAAKDAPEAVASSSETSSLPEAQRVRPAQEAPAEATTAERQAANREASDREAAEREAARRREAAALASYQSAHEAQFSSNDCSRAAEAYADYLRRYPDGSFVLEARYNRGVCLAQLGRNAEARAVLAPFADGTYGNYRRQRAAALLQALGD